MRKAYGKRPAKCSTERDEVRNEENNSFLPEISLCTKIVKQPEVRILIIPHLTLIDIFLSTRKKILFFLFGNRIISSIIRHQNHQVIC